MKDNIFEKIKEQVSIVDTVSKFGVELDKNNKAKCPFHNEKTASFSVDGAKNYFKCFGCGESGDVIDFVAKIKGIDNIESAKLIAEIYNIQIDAMPEEKSKKIKIKDYLKGCQKNIGMTTYFQGRGLTSETINRFCLGFDSTKNCVTIPYSKTMEYYQSRKISDKAFFKPRTEDAGQEPLWGIESLSQTKKPIFVVESPICAISIAQCGGEAVSLCGASNGRKLLDNIKKPKEYVGFVLCFDNDEPGKKASQDLANQLYEKGAKFIELNIADECKDPNELLMKNSEKLKLNVKKAEKRLKAKFKTDKDSFDIEELIKEVIPPTEWIVDGMMPTGLAMLCAPSKYGKSWMVLQLCLSIAEGRTFLGNKTKDCECLYYALEDGKARLQDRIKKMLKNKIPSNKVHFAIKADTLGGGLLSKIEEELESYPKIKLIIIDTLQKVRGKMDKADTLYGNDYREMGAIKDLADKNKVCILLVHHLRKMADDSDIFNMISGSTALMGAADTILVLSKKKRNDSCATFSVTGRDIEQSELVISFNQSEYSWQVDGTSEEIAERKEREDYETNIYVKTIKELVKRNSVNGWSGTAQDLMKAVFDVTGNQVYETTQAVGKVISKFEYKLHCDDISHVLTRGKVRKHTFKKIIREISTYYQRGIYDKKYD